MFMPAKALGDIALCLSLICIIHSADLYQALTLAAHYSARNEVVSDVHGDAHL